MPPELLVLGFGLGAFCPSPGCWPLLDGLDGSTGSGEVPVPSILSPVNFGSLNLTFGIFMSLRALFMKYCQVGPGSFEPKTALPSLAMSGSSLPLLPTQTAVARPGDFLLVSDIV